MYMISTFDILQHPSIALNFPPYLNEEPSVNECLGSQVSPACCVSHHRDSLGYQVGGQGGDKEGGSKKVGEGKD